MSEPDIKLKLCVIGAFAVGKTSLIDRFVRSLYSDQYHTTIGVKVDKKVVDVAGKPVMLMLWDMAGEDEFQKVKLSYLRGAAGYLLVIDRTRRATMDVAVELEQRVRQTVGEVPFVVLANKSDLAGEFDVTDADIESLRGRGWRVECTSAKTGDNVEEAFVSLASRVVEKKR